MLRAKERLFVHAHNKRGVALGKGKVELVDALVRPWQRVAESDASAPGLVTARGSRPPHLGREEQRRGRERQTCRKWSLGIPREQRKGRRMIWKERTPSLAKIQKDHHH